MPTRADAVETRARWAAVVALGVVAVVAVLAVVAVAAPGFRGADVPETEFSGARAAVHLAAVARAPHPVGTVEHERVRDHVVDTAEELGADVTVESDDVVRTGDGGPFATTRVENVVARVAGSAPETSGGRALVLAVHYDSVPTGPGAADDGAGVAALLETMRALRASGGVRNDVVFLFTDAEELGLLGARGYVERNGVDGAGAVLNFEARGSRGPVWMFETGRGNGPLISAFADASPRPVASSVTDEVYKRLPNDTDFTVFLDAGATGLNAAFLEGVQDYHAASDTPETLDADSMQHHGETMLALLRDLGDRDLRALRGDDAVYFDVFARALVRYPAAWAGPLAVVTVAGLAVLIGLGVRRRAAGVGGVLVTAGVGLAGALAAAVACFGLWTLVPVARPSIAALPLSEPWDRGWFTAGFALVAVAVLAGVAWLLRRRATGELLGGGAVVLGVLLLVAAFAAPGASHLPQWPLLASLPALWWHTRTGGRHPAQAADPATTIATDDARRGIAGRSGGVSVVLLALPGVVAAALFAPLFDNLLVALGIAMALVAALLAVLGGLVAVPLLAATRRAGTVALAAATAAVALLAVGVADSGATSAEPTSSGLVYVRDTVDGTTRWLASTPADAWTSQALGAAPVDTTARTYAPQFRDRALLTAPAPDVPLPAPTVAVLADDTTDGTRTVRLRVATTRDAWELQVRLAVEPLRGCVIAGEPVDAGTLRNGADPQGRLVIRHFGAAERDLEIECDVDAGTRLDVEVLDHSVGLAPGVARLVGPRPATTVPYGYGMGLSDGVTVRALVTV